MGHFGRKIQKWASKKGARFRKFSPPFQPPKTPSEMPPDLFKNVGEGDEKKLSDLFSITPKYLGNTF